MGVSYQAQDHDAPPRCGSDDRTHLEMVYAALDVADLQSAAGVPDAPASLPSFRTRLPQAVIRVFRLAALTGAGAYWGACLERWKLISRVQARLGLVLDVNAFWDQVIGLNLQQIGRRSCERRGR